MRITLNPTGHHTATKKRLLEACGLIPYFFADASVARCTSKADRTLAYMEESYGFPTPPMEGGSVAEDGVYSYPGDTDMHPLIAMRDGNVEALVYECGIVCVRDMEDTLIVRMD